MRHHVFAYLAILRNGLELAFQTVDSVAGLYRANAPFKEQPAHAGKALQVWDDRLREFIQQCIECLGRISLKQKTLGLFEIALEVRGEFDEMPGGHVAGAGSGVRFRRTASLQRSQAGARIFHSADGYVVKALACIVNKQQVNALAL